MDKPIGTGESASWDLRDGEELRLENALPVTAEVLVTLKDGSFIRFPLAMRGEFALKSMGSIAGVKMVIPDSEGFGPRRVD